jgi:acyl carrier protein
LRQALDVAPSSRRHDILVGHLKSRVQQVLRLEGPNLVQEDRGLFEMGMDSLMALELKSLLEKDTSLPLPSTLTFNYPTISDLAGYLFGLLSGGSRPEQEVAFVDIPAEAPSDPAGSDGDMTEDELSKALIRKLKELE